MTNPLKTKLLGFSIGTITLFLIALAWWLPKLQVPIGVNSPKDKAEIENASRQTIIQAFGGLFFLITASLTLRNLRLTEDKQATETFGKAIEMIGSESLEVRIAGIYLLEQVAKYSSKIHPAAIKFLLCFVTQRGEQYRYRESTSDYDKDYERTGSNELDLLDLKIALKVIGDRDISNDREPINLTRVFLWGLSLNKAKLDSADFSYAELGSVDFSGARLCRANLYAAQLDRANLSEVNMEYSRLDSAWLDGANLAGSNLRKAQFKEANLTRADLSGADLRGANLENACLLQAILRGASLREDDLEKAIICETILPDGLDIDPNRDCGTIIVPSDG